MPLKYDISVDKRQGKSLVVSLASMNSLSLKMPNRTSTKQSAFGTSLQKEIFLQSIFLDNTNRNMTRKPAENKGNYPQFHDSDNIMNSIAVNAIAFVSD